MARSGGAPSCPSRRSRTQALALAPTVERLLVIRRLGDRAGAIPWDRGTRRLVARADGRPGLRPLREPRLTDPETPYMVIHTSGTTGRPKGAVHVHGGFPIKGAQDMAHGFDVRPGDRVTWLTDLGWMMGPWLISGALLLGATLVLYEGAPGCARVPTGCGRSPRATASPTWASRPPSCGRSRHTAPTRSGGTTCARCGCSARPASRGTRSRGGGCSARWAGAGCPSSTTAAARR